MTDKKKKASGQSKDRHASNRMVRVPPDLYDLMAELAEENGRPLTWEVKLLFQKHLREHGKLPPKT